MAGREKERLFMKSQRLEQDKNRGKMISWFFYTPLLICDFLDEFIKKVKPENILDPVAWSWLALIWIMETLQNKVNITAIEINKDSMEESQKRRKDFPKKNIQYIQWDATEILPKMETAFDFIFWDLPWNTRTNKKYFDVKLDWDIIIMLQSLEKLEDGWYALFTNPDSFFIRVYDKIKGLLEEMWVFLVWSIKLPAGTYYPYTWIASNIIIFQKKVSVDVVFLWELTENNYSKMVDNFFSKQRSNDLAGKIMNKSSIKSFLRDKEKSYEKIDKLIAQGKIETMEWYDVSTKIDLEDKNSIYITTFGFPKIITEFSEYEVKKILDKKARYIQIKLPSTYDSKIFAYFYNSSFGKLYFGCLVSWVINSLSLTTLQNSILYYPTKWYLDKIRQTFEKIESIKHIVSDVDQTLKQDFFAINEVYEMIAKVNVMSEIEYIMKDFPTIIAKLYKEYQDIKTKEDYHDAFDHIDHIFTATSIFCISIMLWWLKRNQTFFDEIADDIIKSVKHFSNLWYGDLYYMYGTIAKKIKEKLSDKDEGRWFMLSLFWTENSHILDSITNKKVYELINDFSKIRNRYGWHKGKIDNDLYKQILPEVESLLHQFILCLSSLKDIRMILWSEKIKRVAEYEYISSLTIFNWYIPSTQKLTLSEAPIEWKLYFTMWWDGSIISLPDLIKYDTSANDKTKVPYIYNRMEWWDLEYITYDIAEKERKKYKIADLHDDLFQKLLAKSNN